MTTSTTSKLSALPFPPKSQTELYSLFTSDPDAARQRMVELAAEQGVTLTVDQVREFLKQMNEDSEFDDIELMLIASDCRCRWSRARGRMLTMTTLNDFKQLRASVPAEVQTELYSLFSANPDAARQRDGRVSDRLNTHCRSSSRLSPSNG